MINATEPGAAPDSFSDLPLQPTGSGVADLEMAYEQMKLTEGNDTAAIRAEDDRTGAPAVFNDDEAESEGHPS